MRHDALVAAFLVAALVPSAALAQTRPEPATITVNGNATLTRPPDQTVVSFGIVTTNDVAARASTRNNEITEALTRALGTLGITGSAIRTTSYSLSYNPRPEVSPNDARVVQPPQPYGYTVRRTVDVSENRTDRAGAIVDAGVGAGATNVNSVSFGIHDRAAAYQEALAAAVRDADSQARILAGAAHVRILGVQTIQNGGSPGLRLIGTAKVAAPLAVATQIDPGTIDVAANVTITYTIAP